MCRGALTLDEGGLMRQAALAGAGLAFLPEHLIESDLHGRRAYCCPGGLDASLSGSLPLFPPVAVIRRQKLRALIDLVREVAL